MSIRAEKQLAVLKHQYVKLQREHQLCEELVTNLKKDKDMLLEKCKELQEKLDAKAKAPRKRSTRKKEEDK